MPIVFFGSSEFSLPSLRACIDSGIPVKLVVTTPDTKKGRGLHSAPTPVKVYAQSQNLPVIAPEKLRNPEILESVKKLSPDYFVVASYGKIIPADWLKVPAKLAINVHPSLLPKYRGAAPINWPILNGDPETGLCLMEVVDKLDAGDVFFTQKIPIGPHDDSISLGCKLSELSYPAVKNLLASLEKGNPVPRMPQNEADMTYARKLTKQDGVIDWKLPAGVLERRVRGLLPWPGAYTFFEGQVLQILKAGPAAGISGNGMPGETVQVTKQGIAVQTGAGPLELLRVKPAGKAEMSGADFARGRRLAPGFRFSAEASP